VSGPPVLPPPRSIISLTSCGGECGDPACMAMVIGCDCATTTHLTVEDAGRLPDGTELAFTCDGCHSVTWFTVRTGDGPP
jgi:hypothetical protein